MKKIVSLILMFFLLTVTVVAAPVVELTEEKTLIKGVTYKSIKSLYSSGWQDIHIITADLNEEHLSLEVLKNSNGESYTQNTLDASKENDAVAAINADFFAAKRGQAGRGSAVGVEIRDGKLYSSASVAESMNTLYKLLGENGFNIDSFTFDITLSAANGRQDKIKLINKYDDLTGIVMYTSDWAEMSVGSVGGVIEVAVDENGIVTEKVTEAEPIAIPENGYVLSAHMSYNTFLLDHVHVGDKVSVDVKSTPDYEKIETAVGGGGVLVRDGIAQTKFSHNISGKNPRTAIGLDKTGTIVTLVVVDGRRNDARGMTQTELAEFMAELGCFNALNFDGGGSTTMVAETDGEHEVLNTLSDGSLRNVTNSLAVMTSADKNLPAVSLRIKPETDVVVGQSVPLSVLGIDDYMREKKILDGVIYETDNGTINDGNWIPERAGTANITANALGLTTTERFWVEDVKDAQNTYKEVGEGGYRFAVFGNTRKKTTGFDRFVMNRATIRMSQTSEFQMLLGADIFPESLEHIKDSYVTADGYKCFGDTDTFITLPNVSGKIYTTDVSVWSKFKNDVENAKGNLFVFIDRNFISENETEVNIFKQILENEAKERNVYVFGGGFVNEYAVRNGVRYINTAGVFPSVALEGTSISYVEYVLVTVNGADVTYEYKQAVR